MFEETTLELSLSGGRVQVRNSNEYGFLRICWVRSDSSAGSVREKLVEGFPFPFTQLG